MKYGRKLAKCPGCLPDVKGAYFDRSWDRDGNDVWKCYNCGHELPCRKSPVRKSGRTAAQSKAIERIKAAVADRNSYGDPANYEFKKVEVKDLDWGAVSMVTEFGRKGDEGTYAALICRDYRHFFIGPKGGITMVSAKDGKKRTGLWESVHCLVK